MVDPETFALNLMLIIGALVLFVAAFIVFVSTWTGISALIWLIQRRRAQREFIRNNRREDGKPYPPFVEGVCSRCRRGSRRVYFAPSGEGLCPLCYEQHWRRVEGYAAA